MNKATAKKLKKAVSITANVLIWVFVVFSLLVTILVFTAQGDEDGVPALFGKSIVTIESKSMQPTFMQGDLVFMTKLTPAEKDALLPENIITYFVDLDGDGDLEINTHRIEKIENGKYITKGDNNDLADNEGDNPYTVDRADIIGICYENGRIPLVGAIIGFLRSSVGFFLCIVLPLVLFFLYELYRFIMLLVAERAKRAPVSAELEEEIKRRAIEEYLKNQSGSTASEATDAAKETAEPASDDAQKPAEESESADGN